MTLDWASNADVGAGQLFEALHAGLTVQLIATGRPDLMTCRCDETVSAVTTRNTYQYDFIPVMSDNALESEGIIGLFHAALFHPFPRSNETIKAHMLPLSEDYLIGADASILDLIKEADSRPCRLVVSGSRITGLVSLSDLQKLPVRAALFALVTSFEITMSEAIRRKFPQDGDWMALLSDGRRAMIKDEIANSKKDDGFINALLFTQFCDKAEIVKKVFRFEESKTKMGEQLSAIQRLRDNLAHANEYATSPAEAKCLCRLVRGILALKSEIASAKHVTDNVD